MISEVQTRQVTNDEPVTPDDILYSCVMYDQSTTYSEVQTR